MTRLVLVTWNDANASATAVYVKSTHHQPTVMHTVGWLLDQDETGLSLACERFTGDDGQWNYRGLTFIPKGMATKVRRLPLRDSQ